MKKNILKLVAMMFVLTSCNEDILDLKPYDKLSDATVWADLSLVETYVNESYNSLSQNSWGNDSYINNSTGWGNHEAPYGWWTGGAVDEIYELHDKTSWSMKADFIVRGELSPSQISHIGRWKRNYALIRGINNFFKNVGNIQGDADKIKSLTAQMYALRAWNYIHLIKNYGGVPIITEVFSTSDTEFNETRSSLDDSVAFVLEDLEKAIQDLDPSYDSSQAGRITKGAAMAMKSNFLLWVASPLNNPTNDLTKWKAASDAAEDVINLGIYSLYEPASYERIFLDKANSEVILAKYYNGNEAWGTTNMENTVNRDLAPNSYGGWGMATPIQNVVDDFQMVDGTDFDWNNPVHAAAPYENRDPRFDATIFYDGRMHRGVTVDTYEGGKDNPIGAVVEPSNSSVTGYYLRKFVDPDWDTANWQAEGMAIFIRLTEIYLNYAEAQNALGEDGTALTYVNKIRERAGVDMPPLTGSGIELRDKIREERRIELVFEGQRYYDVRRWDILEDVMGDAMGITIIKNPDDSKTYSTKTVQDRIYDQKIYWQPIPQTERAKNDKLDQNPFY